MVQPAPQLQQHDASRTREAFEVRARMIGVLIRDARLSAQRSLADCARLMQTTPERIEQWEFGEDTPALPELEMLAAYLNVPLSHFWGMKTLQGSQRDPAEIQAEFLMLRNHMVGAQVRQARQEAGISASALAAQIGIAEHVLGSYEMGEQPLPVHVLSVIAYALGKPMSHFGENHSLVGELLSLREKWRHFAQLPEDIQLFAANPLNIGFIEIAVMLSQMPTDRLRRVGESVLNITM